MDRAILDASVTSAELAAAIRHLRASSAPGIDGLRAEFYLVAPEVFGECFSIVFHDKL